MSESILVGDIGGTNVRLARASVASCGRISLDDVAVMPGDEFPHFEAALQHYLASNGAKRPGEALFAFAGPVANGTVRLTNRDWQVDRRMIETNIGFDRVTLVNDYTAMARSIPELPESDFQIIHEGKVSEERRPILVAGPGTGLGMATLLPYGERGWKVITGEGGHAAFAARNSREWALVQKLRQSNDFVPNELVLAGIGLEPVHRALCEIDGVEWQKMTPAEIMALAQKGDRICRDICEIRAGATLAALGDGALITGTLGGVVITGGVAERLVDWLRQPRALARFFERGPRRDYMMDIPLRLLRSGEAALYGAAALHFDKEADA